MSAIHRDAALWNNGSWNIFSILCEINALALLQMMSKLLVMSHTDSLGSAHWVSGQNLISSLSFIELQLFLPEANASSALSKASQRMSSNCIFQALWIPATPGVGITPGVLVLNLHSGKGLVLWSSLQHSKWLNRKQSLLFAQCVQIHPSAVWALDWG